jgi:hypothetical protein
MSRRVDAMEMLQRAMNGSALVGGMYGSALEGGYFHPPKNRIVEGKVLPVESKRAEVKESKEVNALKEQIRVVKAGERAQKLQQGTAKMTAAKYGKLFSDAAIAKRNAARKSSEDYIDTKLREAYAGRKSIPYAERALIIARARIDLHRRKVDAARAAMTPQKKEENKAKSKARMLANLTALGLQDTPEGRREYRIKRGWTRSPQEKALQKAINADAAVKAAKAKARAEIRARQPA